MHSSQIQGQINCLTLNKDQFPYHCYTACYTGISWDQKQCMCETLTMLLVTQLSSFSTNCGEIGISIIQSPTLKRASRAFYYSSSLSLKIKTWTVFFFFKLRNAIPCFFYKDLLKPNKQPSGATIQPIHFWLPCLCWLEYRDLHIGRRKFTRISYQY